MLSRVFQQGPSDIQVTIPPEPGYAAIVALVGEHDMATADRIDDTLRRFFGTVLVDLGQCTFLDSTVIGVLLRNHAVLEREGFRLELRAGADGPVRRTLRIAGAESVLTIHDV
jgi:anti-sigma B factor antagonist